MSRKCGYCDGPMPEGKALHARYCSENCCTLEHNRRRTQKLFDDGWSAAIEAAAIHAKKYPFNDFGEPAKGILELKPPKVKINART